MAVRVQAVAAAERTEVAYERTLPLGPSNVSMQVSASEDDQTVTISTTLPGRLVLHWGVEGGRDYRGGWRLPGDKCQPEGTINYKNRALQTPFRSADGNGLQARAAQSWRCLPRCHGPTAVLNAWQRVARARPPEIPLLPSKCCGRL